jgi:AcrR family transcriptional regulator
VSAESTTRTKIMRAAEKAFAEHGYHGARLRQIAAAVGIQKASLFHHFPGKEELYRAVLEESVADIGTEIERAARRVAPYAERLRRLVSVYVDLVAQRPAHTRMLLRQALDEDAPATASPGMALDPLFALVVEFVRDGQRAGAFRPLDDPTPLILSVVGTAAFFFTAAHVLAPHWPAARAPRRDFAAAVKRHVTEMAEQMLLLDDQASPRDAGEARHGMPAH